MIANTRQEPPRVEHYPCIDILRAVAALLVVVYHVIEVGQWKEFPITGLALWPRIGWIGVDLFFVISGFVITLSAVSGYRFANEAFVRDFAYRRWMRIAPLYFCTLLAYIWFITPGILFLEPAKVIAHVFSHVFFIHNLHPSTHGSLNGPNWSVALEMQFYFLIALITPWLSRTSPLKALVLFISISWAYRFATTLVLEPGISTPHYQHVFSSQLPGTLDAFGFGIALALLTLNRERYYLARFLTPSWKNFVLLSLIGAAALKGATLLFWVNPDYWGSTGMITFWRTLLAGAFVVILAAAVTFPYKRLGLLLPAGYLGQISYGIYLWHTLVLTSLMTLPWVRGSTLLQWVLVGTILMSAASWHFLEKPLMQRKRAKSTTPPIPATR